MMFEQLFQTIEDRKREKRADSYTAKLIAGGEDAILQKIGEEAIEVIIAAKGQGNQRLIEEVSDLLYHTLVLLAAKDLTPEDIQAELDRRAKK